MVLLTVAVGAKPAFRVLVLSLPASEIGRFTTVALVDDTRSSCRSAPASTVRRAPAAGARSFSTRPKLAPLPAVALPV